MVPSKEEWLKGKEGLVQLASYFVVFSNKTFTRMSFYFNGLNLSYLQV